MNCSESGQDQWPETYASMTSTPSAWTGSSRPASRPAGTTIPVAAAIGDGPLVRASSMSPVVNRQAIVGLCLEAPSHALFNAGHVPMIGEWAALAVLHEAGGERAGNALYEEIFHPVGRLPQFCDGVLRLRVIRKAPTTTCASPRNAAFRSGIGAGGRAGLCRPRGVAEARWAGLRALRRQSCEWRSATKESVAV